MNNDLERMWHKAVVFALRYWGKPEIP